MCGVDYFDEDGFNASRLMVQLRSPVLVAKHWFDKKDHNARMIVGIGLVIGVLFILPLAIVLAMTQVIFIVSIYVLDFILPGTLGTIGFSAGAGWLTGGIGIFITLLLLVLRHIMDMIMAFKLFFNIVVLVIVAFVFTIDAYVDTIQDIQGIRLTLHSFFADPIAMITRSSYGLAAALGIDNNIWVGLVLYFTMFLATSSLIVMAWHYGVRAVDYILRYDWENL